MNYFQYRYIIRMKQTRKKIERSFQKRTSNYSKTI